MALSINFEFAIKLVYLSVVNADLLLNLTIYKKRPHLSIFISPPAHRNCKLNRCDVIIVNIVNKSLFRSQIYFFDLDRNPAFLKSCSFKSPKLALSRGE